MDPLPHPPRRLLPGDVLHGHYQIEAVLGSGGMGDVYQARHLLLEHRRVAIKVIRPNKAQAERASRRFRQEAELLSQIEHPHLVKLYEFFEEGGQQFIVMEYIQGQTLSDLIPTPPQFLEEWQVLQWARQLCDALDYLHRRQPPILFRDLKPSNVMLDSHGQVKLIDFGIALAVSEGVQTATGVGTLSYSAPEQLQGHPSVRADVYSLGATLYTLVTAEIPPLAVIRSVEDPLQPPRQVNPSVSPTLEAAIMNMLAVEPGARPSGVPEAWAMLNARAPVRLVATLTRRRRRPSPILMLLPLLAVGGYLSAHETLEVDVSPSDAMVQVNGRTVTDRPIKLSGLWWGQSIEISAERPGFVRQTERISARQGKVALTLASQPLEVVVSTSAGAAGLLIDNAMAGHVTGDPSPVRISPGQHVLSLLPESGWETPAPQQVTAQPGQNPPPVRFTLQPKPATVTFEVPPGVSVTVNGVPARGTPPRLSDISTPRMEVKAQGPGYESFEQGFDTPPGGSHSIKLDIIPIPRFTAHPVDTGPVPTMPDDALVVPGVRLGDVNLGEMAGRLVGRDHLLPRQTGQRYGWYSGIDYTINVNMDGRITSALSTSARYRTVSGLHVGSTETEVEAAMGRPPRRLDRLARARLFYDGITFVVDKASGAVLRIRIHRGLTAPDED